jgi:hypothetical protein
VDTAESVANAVEHPIDTAKIVINGAISIVKAAANGDPKAFGQVVATVATVAYAAENVKVRAYENRLKAAAYVLMFMRWRREGPLDPTSMSR